MVDRRTLIAAGLAALAPGAARAQPMGLEDIEGLSGGRLGVYAVDTGTGRTLAHRADERFAMCSTFKAPLAAAVLQRIDRGQERAERLLPLKKTDMKSHAPVSETFLAKGAIPVGTACQAIVEVSDNPAANLLLATIGGPAGFTRWLRRQGDEVTRLDRWELELNSAIPGDPRDTTTPRAMARTLQRLLLGDALSAGSRTRLTDWMVGSTTGLERLRKHLPPGWRAADKTGTGGNGSTNDIAVLWPPSGAPIVVACYLTATAAPLPVRETIHATVGAFVAAELGPKV